MKKDIIYCFIIVILIGVIALFIERYSHKVKEVDTISYNIKHAQDSTKQWVNKYGILVASNNNLQGTIKELKITNQKDLDNTIKTLQIKEKQIEGLQKTIATSKISFNERVDTSHRGDTTSSFIHNQPFISVIEHTVHDTAFVQVLDTVPITQVENWSRKWFLWSKTYQVQAFSDRKDVTVIGEHSMMVIKEKPKVLSKAVFIGIGLAAGFILFHH